MVLFTSEQRENFKKDKKAFIATIKAIMPDHYVISDGLVQNGDVLYWHSEESPELFDLPNSSHKSNIIDYPQLYSIKLPTYSFETKWGELSDEAIYHDS